MDMKIKILVVDNSLFMRNLICSRLEKEGYVTTQAENGEAALAQLQKDPDVQLITMNVELSGINGFETYQQLRHDPFLSVNSHNLPVVFITSYDSLEDRKKGFDLGAADFVNKAFIDTELVSTINRLCQVNRDMEGLRAIVADDSIFARKIVQRILDSCGVIVTEADNGRKAFDLIAASPDGYDMLITDLNMPEMSGMELTRKIRLELGLHDLPILMLSVTEDKVTQIEMFRAGISDYLTKPFIKEELLGRLHAHLEVAMVNKKLKEQLEELTLSRAALEKSSKERGELLHLLCHDLANPIGAILTVLDVVEGSPELFDTLKEDLRKGAQHSLNVIELVRKMRAMEEGKLLLELAEVDLSAALQESSVLLQRRLNEKDMTLNIEVDGDHMILADETSLINSVFNNIISNAIKFSRPGSAIDVTAEEDDRYMLLTFRDHGIGMPPELLNDLFDLNKATSRIGTAGEEGTGFGMPLVKKFVEAYGGRIEIRSQEEKMNSADHGTAVKLSLRLA